MKNEDSILSLCSFRIIPGRQTLLQALPLEKKRNLKIFHIEIVPSQTDAEPCDCSNRFQSDKEPSVIKSLLAGKDKNHIPIDEHCTSHQRAELRATGRMIIHVRSVTVR